MTLIDVDNASFGYAGVAVVQAAALRLAAGKCLGIFGANGSGKSTLVRGITGLQPPLAGQVRRAAGLRIGYLPQHRGMDPHWPMTGLDAASLALSAQRPGGWLWGQRAAVLAALQRLQVADLAPRRFSQLSGGQQQRVLLAGALAAEPQLLLLDEPSEGLDVASRALLVRTLREQRSAGLGVVIISHDVEDLLDLADDIAWLHPRAAEGQPSRVEIIAPDTFAQRVLHRRGAS